MPIFNYLLLPYDVYSDNDLLLKEIFIFKHNPNTDNPSEPYFTLPAFFHNCFDLMLLISSIITFQPLLEFRGHVLFPSPVQAKI